MLHGKGKGAWFCCNSSLSKERIFLLRDLKKILTLSFRTRNKYWTTFWEPPAFARPSSSTQETACCCTGCCVLLFFAVSHLTFWFPTAVTKMTSRVLHPSQHFSPRVLYRKDYCAKCWQCHKVFCCVRTWALSFLKRPKNKCISLFPA